MNKNWNPTPKGWVIVGTCCVLLIVSVASIDLHGLEEATLQVATIAVIFAYFLPLILVVVGIVALVRYCWRRP
jgi:amino acid transporter